MPSDDFLGLFVSHTKALHKNASDFLGLLHEGVQKTVAACTGESRKIKPTRRLVSHTIPPPIVNEAPDEDVPPFKQKMKTMFPEKYGGALFDVNATVNIHTLDQEMNAFLLSYEHVIPRSTFHRYAIKLMRRNHWAEQIKRERRMSILFTPGDNVSKMIEYTKDLKNFIRTTYRRDQNRTCVKIKQLCFHNQVIAAEIRRHCVDNMTPEELNLYYNIRKLAEEYISIFYRSITTPELNAEISNYMRQCASALNA